jgi:hypothetical protein
VCVCAIMEASHWVLVLVLVCVCVCVCARAIMEITCWETRGVNE